ncbi:MAG: hypothetical protein IJU55_04765 [Selenomonadaceae bacterium]|nr:hypothetical protein [Selenomonadaceae bacterium]
MTLRQEALQIINDIPENSLSELVQNLRDFKLKLTKKSSESNLDAESRRAAAFAKLAEWRDLNKDRLNSDFEVDPKKSAAMAAIAEWQERNRDFLNSGVDWDKERELAMEEKYGSFN